MKLGTVSYLNVQPMIWAIEKGIIGDPSISITPRIPSQLASELARGAYDTAIVPVFEYFRHPDLYSYIHGPVIATRDQVYSVLLVSASPWDQLHTVYLDSSSLTSIHLFKVLSAEKKLDIHYCDTRDRLVPRPLPPGTGWVVIGDPAIQEYDLHPYRYDLGSEWKKLTGLPFVFAAWLVPSGSHPTGMTQLLNRSLEIGLDNLDQVASDTAPRFGVTPEFASDYFKQNIQYHMGKEELAGWNLFGKLCHKHQLILNLPPLRKYQDNQRTTSRENRFL